MNLENIMLSKINQSWNNNYCMIPLIWGKSIEKESREEVTRDCGEREWGVTVQWVWNFYLGWWKVLEMDSGYDCTTLWMYFMPLNCTLFKRMAKMVSFIWCIFTRPLPHGVAAGHLLSLASVIPRPHLLSQLFSNNPFRHAPMCRAHFIVLKGLGLALS